MGTGKVGCYEGQGPTWGPLPPVSQVPSPAVSPLPGRGTHTLGSHTPSSPAALKLNQHHFPGKQQLALITLPSLTVWGPGPASAHWGPRDSLQLEGRPGGCSWEAWAPYLPGWW